MCVIVYLSVKDFLFNITPCSLIRQRNICLPAVIVTLWNEEKEGDVIVIDRRNVKEVGTSGKKGGITWLTEYLKAKNKVWLLSHSLCLYHSCTCAPTHTQEAGFRLESILTYLVLQIVSRHRKEPETWNCRAICLRAGSALIPLSINVQSWTPLSTLSF